MMVPYVVSGNKTEQNLVEIRYDISKHSFQVKCDELRALQFQPIHALSLSVRLFSLRGFYMRYLELFERSWHTVSLMQNLGNQYLSIDFDCVESSQNLSTLFQVSMISFHVKIMP